MSEKKQNKEIELVEVDGVELPISALEELSDNKGDTNDKK